MIYYSFKETMRYAYIFFLKEENETNREYNHLNNFFLAVRTEVILCLVK